MRRIAVMTDQPRAALPSWAYLLVVATVFCTFGPLLTADFTGTAGQATGGVNAVAAITTSAVRYVVRCVVEALLGQPLPAGGGDMPSVRLVLPVALLFLLSAGLQAWDRQRIP